MVFFTKRNPSRPMLFLNQVILALIDGAAGIEKIRIMPIIQSGLYSGPLALSLDLNNHTCSLWQVQPLNLLASKSVRL
jgi:hypothetical protein